MKLNTLVLAALLLPFGAMAQWSAPPASAPVTLEQAVIRATVTDPVGDTFNPGPDIIGFSASANSVNLTMVLTFAGAIVPPPGGGGGNEAVGAILIDVDQNGATGSATSLVTTFCPMPPAGFGPEFQVFLFGYNAATQTAPITNVAGTTTFGNAQVTYGANSVNIVVPNSVIADDGLVNLNAVIGNLATPTDCAPDGAVLFSGQSTTAVPTLSPWGIAVVVLVIALGGLAYVRRTKAHQFA